MKKRLLLAAFALPLMSGCLLFNKLGVNPDSIKGTEASDRVFTAALIGGLVAGDRVSAFFTDALAGIEPDEYYKTKDVETCESNLLFISPFISFGRLIFLSTCKLEPDGPII